MKVFGIAGWSGSGKTTLLVRLVPVLVSRGIEVATCKHSHHDPAIGDAETRALFAAGAREALVASPRRFALIHELAAEPEPDLARMTKLAGGVDLLLVEGYKFSSHPKLEVWSAELGKPMLAPDDPSVVALASDDALHGYGRPLFARDDVDGIARFIMEEALPGPAGTGPGTGSQARRK